MHLTETTPYNFFFLLHSRASQALSVIIVNTIQQALASNHLEPNEAQKLAGRGWRILRPPHIEILTRTFKITGDTSFAHKHGFDGLSGVSKFHEHILTP